MDSPLPQNVGALGRGQERRELAGSFFFFLNISLNKIRVWIFYQIAKGIDPWHTVAKDTYCQCQNFYQENHWILEAGNFCRKLESKKVSANSPLKILPGGLLFSTEIGIWL